MKTRIRAGIVGTVVLAMAMVMASAGTGFGAPSGGKGSASRTKAASLRNPWGIVMVLFAKGTGGVPDVEQPTTWDDGYMRSSASNTSLRS